LEDTGLSPGDRPPGVVDAVDAWERDSADSFDSLWILLVIGVCGVKALSRDMHKTM
jgi:hypothetical protein